MCDTSVAVGSATATGTTIFGKNSDRNVNEAQPLCYAPRRRHQPGDSVQCQYLRIPQVEQTWEVIGSRPWWLWGFETGVNEWGVAIGNEAVLSKEPYSETGLLGMDLLRLGLERGRDADEALGVITELLERHGQGGSAEYGGKRYYHNSFIIADPETAWVLETSGRHWVAQRVHGARSISNVYTIETHWDRASEDLVDFARAQGWWEPGELFNFARAYGDYTVEFAPRNVRYQRACHLLGSAAGSIETVTMMGYLRDHYEGSYLEPRWAPQELLFSSICMHSSAQYPGETASSMVVELRREAAPLTATIWHAFSSPCLSAYHPVYLGGVGLDPALDQGSNHFDPSSPWWAFERLQRTVDADPSLAPRVRAVLGSCESEWRARAVDVEAVARTIRDASDIDGARQTLRAFMDATVAEMLAAVGQLQRELDAVDGNWTGLQPEHRAQINDAAGLELGRQRVRA